MNDASSRALRRVARLLLCVPLVGLAETPPVAPNDDRAAPCCLQFEDVHGEAASAWVAARNAESDARLAGDPRYRSEVERFVRLGQAGGQDTELNGGYVHTVARDDAHPLGLWRVMELARGTPAWRDVLDLDALARRESVRWQFRPGWLNPACDRSLGSRCLVGLSPDGGDRTVLREFDLATGRFVADGFAVPVAARTVVAWIERDRVLVSTDFGPGTQSDAGYPLQARVWTRGEPLSAARPIFEAPPGTVLFIPHALKSSGPPLYLAEVWLRGEPSPEYWRLRLDAPAERLALPAPVVQYRGVVGVLDGRIIVMTAQAAEVAGRSVRAGSLLAIPVEGRGDPEVVFEPGDAEAIDPIFHLAMATDRLWFVAMRDVDAHLWSAARRHGRWVLDAHRLPPHAAAQMLTGETAGDAVMVKVESLTTPPRTMLVHAHGPATTIDRAAPVFDAARFTTDQRFATSRDGTRVPYYLVRPRRFVFDGRAAGLVSAYGGFGVSWLPAYASREFKTDLALPLLERGGVFVLANIRGGGEYGPAWHAAARGRLRQNGLDDLAAIARDLVRIGAVAPGRLGLIGGSNGGMLAAATGLQSPTLFEAVIAEVPLTDLLRFPKLYTGAVWINEYGDPDDPRDAAALLGYSPLQNVRGAVAYPEMLLVTSTSDDRVHPGHARRLAEALRRVGRPVLFHESVEGGHEGLASLRRQAEVRALETVYLLQKLDLQDRVR